MENRHQPHVQIHPNVASFYYNVVIFTPTRPGEVELNKGDTITTIKVDGAANEDLYTFRAKEEELRALYERLREHFRVGKDETYVDGKLEATEQHLQDMRALVYDYNIEKRGILVNVPIRTQTKPNDDRPLNDERE